MLSLLYESLSTLYKGIFNIGNLPPLIFLFVNGCVFYYIDEPFQKLTHRFLKLEDKEFTLVSLFMIIGLILFSVILSSATKFLRDLLEGKFLKYLKLYEYFSKPYYYDKINTDKEFKESIRSLDNYREKKSDWLINMRNMREARKSADKKGVSEYIIDNETRKKIDDLISKQERGETINVEDIKCAVDSLIKNINKIDKDKGGECTLDRYHMLLLDVIDHEEERRVGICEQRYNKKQLSFPANVVAPTKMGIIAGTAQNYAESNYSMNLNFFVSRLQKVIKSDSVFNQTLQDAKTKLDFSVNMFWLTFISTFFWLIVLPHYVNSFFILLLVYFLLPIILFIFYEIALQYYRAFLDLYCNAVDLYRMDLLKSLHVSLPANADEECLIWKTLEQRLVHGDKKKNYWFQYPKEGP